MFASDVTLASSLWSLFGYEQQRESLLAAAERDRNHEHGVAQTLEIIFTKKPVAILLVKHGI